MNNKKTEDTKTALKLLNKYADSYNRLEEENRILIQEVKDLKSSLQINKEIIKGLVSTKNESEQNLIYLTKLKEEVQNLSALNDKLNKENHDFHSKLSYLQQIQYETSSMESSRIEKLKGKMFYMEQLIAKKDNLIAVLKQKQSGTLISSSFTSNNHSTSVLEKEIYVVEPSVAVNHLHEELEMYKHVSEGFNESIKEYVNRIQKYEKIIQDQHLELMKLRTNLKVETKFPINYPQILNKEDEKVIILSTNKREELQSIRTNTEDDKNVLYSPAGEAFPKKVDMKPVHQDYKEFLPNLDMSKIKRNKREVPNELKKKKVDLDQKFLEEILTNPEIIRLFENVELSRDEFLNFVYNKTAIKLMKTFEIILKQFDEKKKELRKVEEELSKKYDDIMVQNKKYFELLQENNNLKMKFRNDFKSYPLKPNNNTIDDSNDNSMVVNNISIIQNESKIVNNFNEFNINIKKEVEEEEIKDKKNKRNETDFINDMVELKLNDDVISDIKKNRNTKSKVKRNKSIVDINMTAGECQIDLLNNSTNIITSSSKLNKFLENLNKGQSLNTFYTDKKKF